MVLLLCGTTTALLPPPPLLPLLWQALPLLKCGKTSI
jgi:hypothetical protein